MSSILFLPRSRVVAEPERADLAGALTLAPAASGLIGGSAVAAKGGWRGPTLGFVAVGISASVRLGAD
jgi:hypothetical protein